MAGCQNITPFAFFCSNKFNHASPHRANQRRRVCRDSRDVRLPTTAIIVALTEVFHEVVDVDAELLASDRFVSVQDVVLVENCKESTVFVEVLQLALEVLGVALEGGFAFCMEEVLVLER